MFFTLQTFRLLALSFVDLHCVTMARKFNGEQFAEAQKVPQIQWGALTNNGDMPEQWHIAGLMTAHQVHTGVQTLKFHYESMVTFKYILESGSIDDGPVIYRRCNNKQPQIAFRYTAVKVMQVEVDEVINDVTWKLSVTSPLAGHAG